jgi:hypothetical protein
VPTLEPDLEQGTKSPREIEDTIMRGVESLPIGFVVFVAALFALGNPFSERIASLVNDARGRQRQMPLMSEEERRAAELERYGARVVERTQARRAVIAQLVAGQLTLLQAAQYFRTLIDVDPAHASSEFDMPKGQSEAERYCRQVIVYTSGELMLAGSEQASQVVDRLEAELNDYLKRNGRLKWPEATPATVETVAY